MIIQCENCSRKFVVRDQDIPTAGRTVKCGYCSVTWHQMPISSPKKIIKQKKITSVIDQSDESPSVEKIKASDGKTYKFLGSQWAELLPSGKTGLFAKKKIGKELDKITGRKVEKISEKKTKQTIKELNPSLQTINNKEKLTDNYRQKDGIGFFGYFFLLIIVGFSLVGILKTFESDLILHFPEVEYVYEMLNQQLIYVSETVKNMITILKDLIESY